MAQAQTSKTAQMAICCRIWSHWTESKKPKEVSGYDYTTRLLVNSDLENVFWQKDVV